MFGFKSNKNKVTKQDYRDLQNMIIEQLVKDEDGNNIIDPEYFHQTCSIEFTASGKPKKLKYEPEKYSKSKNTKNIEGIQNYSNTTRRRYNEESYSDLYLDHLAGDITASALIGLDPDEY